MKKFINKIILFTIPLMIIIFIFICMAIIVHKPSITDTKKIENSKVKIKQRKLCF